MMYSTGEISPEARRKLVGNEGEIGTDYIQGPQVPLGNATGW